MKSLLALLAALLMSNANAGVTYTWHNTLADAQHLPLNIEMTIIFSEEAVRSGNVFFEAVPCMDPDTHSQYCFKDPNGPIEMFYFSANRTMFFYPQDKFLDIVSGLNIYGVFHNDLFYGTIWARNVDTEVLISGGTVVYFTSEDPSSTINGCRVTPASCSGAEGYLQAVPEPSSVALLGVAIGGLMLSRRRSKRA